MFLRVGRLGVELAQLIVHARVGRDRGADVDADGRRVDELDVRDAVGFDRANVRGQGIAVDLRFQRGDKALEHHRRLARTGHAGDDREAALGDVDLKRLDSVDLRSGQMNRAVCEQFVLFGALAQLCFSLAGEERPNLRIWVFFDHWDVPLGDDMAAFGARLGAHFDDPVGLLQDLCIVIDENHGVAVSHQIVHHAGQAHDIRRVQTDRRLVEHIEDASRAVAHGAGELHALPLAGGEGRGRAVERQVAEAQVDEPLCRALKRFADALGHRAHLLRKTFRHAAHPVDKVRERHCAGLVERNAAQLRRAGGRRETRAVTVGAGLFLEEFFDALHALFVLNLGECVFDGIDGVEVGEVQLARLVGILVVVEDVLLLRGAVEDDVLFAFGQVAERYIRAHAHLAADVGHQRPHQAVPRRDRAAVDGQGIVGHECV